ncbi:MAG: 4'-phosphopantetheinyl transferase superfamily protein [Deltaproteobacteria bacterium]|nr:4'-phosphopantetheinyl transferase superfamily protein [Deltaproteobacteria bacterium]
MSLSISCWQPAPQHLNLAAGQLHLWRIPLAATEKIEPLKALLSADERARADRFVDPAKGRQFIFSRSCLRQILARYLRTDPAAIIFCYGRRGKPFLSLETLPAYYFNLSHSGRWLLLAVTTVGDVGVDIEQLDSQLDYQSLATQFFTAHELSQLKSCRTNRRRREFYRLWTLKEARLKSTGEGFSSSVEPLSNPVDGLYRSFPIAENYLAALVCSGEITSIIRYQPTD